MAKRTEQLTPRDALRKGWLAYLGVYGAAYERAEAILTGKGADIFDEFVEKGEEVENRAQDALAEMRERAGEMYGDRFDGLRRFMPQNKAGKGRVEDLEAEVAALNKKIASLTKTKKKTSRRSTKKAA